jgi:anionic cell wall polymer biosynthesis LytR-Cps2A-Psr (LCP) family protein
MRNFNGSEALSYGRYRDDSDFYRGVRQQEILKEIIKKITLNPALMNNVPNLINKISNDVKYNFSGDIIDDIIFLSKYLSQYQTIALERFEMVQAPGMSAEDYILTDESLKTFTGLYNATIDPTKIETPTPSN